MKHTKITSFLLIILIMSACVKRSDERGHLEVLEKENISIIQNKYEKGELTLDELRYIFGSPEQIIENGNKEIWIYFATTSNYKAFFTPKIKEFSVIKVVVENNKIVAILDNVDEPNKIKYATGKTESKGDDTSLYKEILGNVGKFNPAKK